MFVPLATLDRAVRLVDGLADLDDPDHFAGAVLPLLADIVGCDLVTFNEIGTAPWRVRFADHPVDSVHPDDHIRFAEHVHEHPLVNHYRQTGDGRPVKLSDFLSVVDLHHLGLYADFFGRVNVEHQLAFTIATPSTEVVGFALNRARRDFSEQDRDLVGVLRAPLMAALSRVKRRQQARAALVDLQHPPPPELSARELTVMLMVADGKTNAAIARALDISPRTIAKHLEHVYRKIDVTSRTAAAVKITGTRADTPQSHTTP
jgi:DNA-binding CsgD family transcriptional regulator